MREILFRGKDKVTGEWITGFLVSPKHIGDWVTANPVDPKTVGQFIGLTDNNGKKIFEGDIVQFYGTYNLEVFIEKGHAKIRWFDTVTNSKCKDMFYGYDDELGDCEVIGNIHDNQELLEVSDGN